jgi:hypothetical protein
MRAELKIAEIGAYPTSFPVPPEHRVALGIGTGTAIERDAVAVKVRTAGERGRRVEENLRQAAR